MRDESGTSATTVVGMTRRAWAAGLLGSFSTVLIPRSARADRYGPAGGPRLLVIGDSMIAGGLGLYLARALGEDGYDVTRRGKSSSGLARPDFFDWEHEARTLVGQDPFDATIVMFGGNDVQGLFMGKKADPPWIRWPEDGWAEEYARRVVALCELVAPDQQQIFWVGMPVMRPERFHRKVQRVNTIFRAEMAIRKNAEFIDIWDLLADENGNYTDRLPLPSPPEPEPETTRKRKRKRKTITVRAGDGIHLTVAGAHYVADYVHQRVLGVIQRKLPAAG